MAYTSQITVNSIAATAITANSFCTEIRVVENAGVAGFPTTDYYVYKPTTGQTPTRIGAGIGYVFRSKRSFFKLGQTVGYVQTVSGSTTFDQDEDHP